MKTKLFRHIFGALYAVLFSICAVGSLTTGWALSVPQLPRIGLMLAVLSAAASILWYFRWGWTAVLFLAGIILHKLAAECALAEQLQSLAHFITTHYHAVYRWPVLGKAFGEGYASALFLIGFLTVLVVTYGICQSRSCWIMVPAVLFPLILCLITTDTLPEGKYLYMFFLGLILLTVTEWTRLKKPEQYAGLTLKTMIPAALMLAILFYCNPQAEYVNYAAMLRENTVVLVQRIKDTAEYVLYGGVTGSGTAEKLNLRNVGPKGDYSYAALKVNSPYTGTLYLRGRDYDMYTGTTWEASERRSEILPAGPGGIGTLTVHTYRVCDVRYTPYYSADMIRLLGGCIENTTGTKSYSYKVSYFMDKCALPSVRYTTLPEATKVWAEDMVSEILHEATADSDKVQRITAYVKKCAVYELSTEVMDSTSDDFAQWFLRESDTGYCVHFATAAAVLLRAAGIPARYVEGYAAHCQAKENTVISSTQAHAWVEYYDRELSVWSILDATPAAAITAGEIISDENTKENEAPEALPEPEETDELDETEDIADSHDDSGNGEGREDDGSETDDSRAEEEIPGMYTEAGKRFRLPDWFTYILWGISAAALILFFVFLQAKLRAAIVWKRWNTGDPNTMALRRWRQSQRMAKRMKTDLPQELHQLALKATFSQHILSPEELERFDAFRRRILEEISEMPFLRKCTMRWWFAML